MLKSVFKKLGLFKTTYIKITTRSSAIAKAQKLEPAQIIDDKKFTTAPEPIIKYADRGKFFAHTSCKTLIHYPWDYEYWKSQ